MELIVVVIIVGVLAAVAVFNYASTIEKTRGSEAKVNLGTLRSHELAYYREFGSYATITDNTTPDIFSTGLPIGPGTTCINTNYYFEYQCNAASPQACVANRCQAGGKAPAGGAGAGNWTIYLVNGTIVGP